MRNFKVILILLIVLSARKFLNPLGIFDNAQTAKMFFYGLSGFGLVLTFGSKIALNRFNSFPRKAYLFIFVGIFLAAFMAGNYQQQTMAGSFVAVIPYTLGYLFLYILLKLQPKEQQVIRIISILIVISIVTYIINYFSYPMMPFDTKGSNSAINDSRGVYRIGVPFIQLFIFGLLYSVNQWLLDGKKKWLIYIGILLTMIFLSVTRQVIFISVLLSSWLMMKRIPFHKKVLFLVLLVVCVLFILPKIPIYKALVETSHLEIESNETKIENARLRAFRFYTDQYQTNGWTRIFGNGVPSIGKSSWGVKYEKDTYSEGVYASDIGWIGFYWYFGLIASISVFILFFKAYRKKKDSEHEYLSYFCLALIFLSVASGPIIFYGEIISLMIPLYLVYKDQGHSSSHIIQRGI